MATKEYVRYLSDKEVGVRYLDNRSISTDVINKLIQDQNIKFGRSKIMFNMRSLETYHTRGYKSRFTGPRCGPKEINEMISRELGVGPLMLKKTWEKIHSEKGYFEVWIVEGSIDYCTMLKITDDVIGLPSITYLKKLIVDLKKINPGIVINILVDNDDAGNKAVENLKKHPELLDNVNDCREYIDGKDINEDVMGGYTISTEQARFHGIALYS